MSIIVNNPIITKNKKVIALPRDKLIARSMLISALKTHPSLTVEDIRYFVNDFSIKKLKNKQLADLILRIYKLTNVGRFSLTFNQDLDSHIKSRDSDRIEILIKVAGNECAWPEVYDNLLLTPEEKQSIEKMALREYFSILNTLETADPADDLDNIIPCTVSVDNIIGIGENTNVYSQCYDHVCISEAQQSGKIISFKSEIPQVAFVADQTERYCFPLLDLIKQLAENNYVNAQTNKKFSDITLTQLLLKYEKEIKMYRHYIDTLKQLKCLPMQ